MGRNWSELLQELRVNWWHPSACTAFLLDVVESRIAGAVAGGAVLAFIAVLWLLVPWTVARRSAPRRAVTRDS